MDSKDPKKSSPPSGPPPNPQQASGPQEDNPNGEESSGSGTASGPDTISSSSPRSSHSSSASPNTASSPSRTAANHSGRSSHAQGGTRERHSHPHNRKVTNQSGGACVNANHGSHSRNLHRDGHTLQRRERQRHTGTSRDRQEAQNNAPVALKDDDEEEQEACEVSSSTEPSTSQESNAQAAPVFPVAPLPVPPSLVVGGAAAAAAHSLPPNHTMQYNWQAGKTTLKERLAFMFNNETMADVHFVVGKGPNTQRIPAHKFVLAIGSAVFDAMFNGGMATTSSEVELPDVEPAAFLALLKFLYSDEVLIGPETVMTTLYTAKKYAVPALEQSCVEFLKRNLSSDNAFMLLTQARLFDESQLAALCLESIDKNTSEALAAEGFTDIDLDTLCVVLERDTLGIRECKLFNAACKWSEAECLRESLPVTASNKRSMLSRGLQLIRFPLMTVEEFAMGAAQSGILTDREVVELFLHFTVNPKPSVNFQDTPRCCLTGKEQVVSRFCQIESRWGYSGTSDRIRFMVNRRIFVVGFGLYGSIHGSAEYSVNIQIIHTDSGKVCGQNDTSFQCDGSNSTFRVMFKEPIEVQPNTNFTACSTLKGPDSYYGTKGLRKVTHESVTSGKVTFQFTYAAGNNNGTSVEDGQLPEIIFYT